MPRPNLWEAGVGLRGPTPISIVGRGRLELPTSRLSGVRSNHLSYRPEGRLQPRASAKALLR